MTVDAAVLATIAGMSVATYVTKAGGLWMMGRVDVSGQVEAWLDAIPGAVVVSIVAPSLVTGGPVEWTAGAAVLVVAWRTENILASMTVGVGLVWALRNAPPVF